MNKSYKEGPNFSSINIIEDFVFPVVIIFGIPKSLKVYKFNASSSKYNSSFALDSIFIITGVLSEILILSYISKDEVLPIFFCISYFLKIILFRFASICFSLSFISWVNNILAVESLNKFFLSIFF